VGYLDDLLIVPLGLAFAARLIPPAVLAEHRAKAAQLLSQPQPSSLAGAAIVLTLWAVVLAWLGSVAWRILRD
jgi:hypothetical protein